MGVEIRHHFACAALFLILFTPYPVLFTACPLPLNFLSLLS